MEVWFPICPSPAGTATKPPATYPNWGISAVERNSFQIVSLPICVAIRRSRLRSDHLSRHGRLWNEEVFFPENRTCYRQRPSAEILPTGGRFQRDRQRPTVTATTTRIAATKKNFVEQNGSKTGADGMSGLVRTERLVHFLGDAR